MRITFLILFIAATAACEKTQKSSGDDFYYLSFHDNNPTDTVSYNKVNSKIEKNSRQLFQSRFEYKNTQHLISFYAMDVGVPVDAEELFYTLDTIGIIYSRSITWPIYVRLYSNNDSITNLIDLALNNIILNPDLHCYNCGQSEKRIPAATMPSIIKDK